MFSSETRSAPSGKPIARLRDRRAYALAALEARAVPWETLAAVGAERGARKTTWQCKPEIGDRFDFSELTFTSTVATSAETNHATD